jgi:hypothetical protein
MEFLLIKDWVMKMLFSKKAIFAVAVCSSLVVQPSHASYSMSDAAKYAIGAAVVGGGLYALYKNWPTQEQRAAWAAEKARRAEIAKLVVSTGNDSQYKNVIRENQNLLTILERYEQSVQQNPGEFEPYPVASKGRYKIADESESLFGWGSLFGSIAQSYSAGESVVARSSEEKMAMSLLSPEDQKSAEEKRERAKRRAREQVDAKRDIAEKEAIARASTINSWFRESIIRYMNGEVAARLNVDDAALTVSTSNESQYKNAIRENQNLLTMLERYEHSRQGALGYQIYPQALKIKYIRRDESESIFSWSSVGVAGATALLGFVAVGARSSEEEKALASLPEAERKSAEAARRRRQRNVVENAAEGYSVKQEWAVAKVCTVNSWFRESIIRYMNGQMDRLDVWDDSMLNNIW